MNEKSSGRQCSIKPKNGSLKHKPQSADNPVQKTFLASTCKFGRQHAQLGFRDANFMVQPVKVGFRDANG